MTRRVDRGLPCRRTLEKIHRTIEQLLLVLARAKDSELIHESQKTMDRCHAYIRDVGQPTDRDQEESTFTKKARTELASEEQAQQPELASQPCQRPRTKRVQLTGLGYIRLRIMVARGRFELPSMGLFLVLESKAHHWPGHCFRPLLVHYTTGLQETRVFGQVPISLPRNRL